MATNEYIRQWLPQVPGWRVVEVDGVKRITKTFRFKDFTAAMRFVNQAAGVAEGEGHHPDIHISWNTVRLEAWTHAIKGLHENDFILAAKINALR